MPFAKYPTFTQFLQYHQSFELGRTLLSAQYGTISEQVVSSTLKVTDCFETDIKWASIFGVYLGTYIYRLQQIKFEFSGCNSTVFLDSFL
jgi:hypothetical protein